MLRLLHMADLHPNNAATVAGRIILDPETGLNRSLTDFRKSLDFAVGLAVSDEHRCDVALLTGDLFDSPRPHANEIRLIVNMVLRLAEAMPVCIIAGNHDISQNPQDASALQCLAGIPNVFLRERADSSLLQVKGQYVRICSLPYPTKGRLLTQELAKDAPPEQVTAFINEGLLSIIRSFRFDLQPGEFSILLAHGSVSQAKVGDQPRSLAHDILIPVHECTDFDYVALGHIHQGQQVGPNAWYCSSLMRQSFGEEHEAKGFNLVSLEHGEPARVVHVRNPHARAYCTLTAAELFVAETSGGLDPETIYRVKDELLPTELESYRFLFEACRKKLPCFQMDIAVVSEDRTRDAGMSACLSIDDAMDRALHEIVEPVDVPVILEKHHTLVEECRS